MSDKSREDWLRPRLETLNRASGLVPAQARAVDLVARTYAEAEMETPGERDTAAAAARTSIATEIASRWPGTPYVIRQGAVEDYPELGLGPAKDALLVFGVVYRADD
ncbi:hypothetical protein [Actinorugispora endophytica]|uniref:Uncharacterized protein n=1 Tax=Actinorugispora endophytica TaxID=1605990 RepID=A0A4R6UWE6_9ACTN|nr:hypothetical protein [Actinorugispora endophytica]TDQ50309.1 hypothetical protein EV190_11378 [Actinorugispora endophytica]